MKPNNMHGKAERLSKDDMLKTIKRLLKYIIVPYKKQFIFVLICIVLSSVAGVISSMFLGILIDNYIEPLTKVFNPSFVGLFKAILIMVCIYLVGILSSLAFNRMMVTISQGVLKKFVTTCLRECKSFL